MPDLSRVVVVGAGLAGLRAVETLRGEGFDGEIIVVGEEGHRPYTRPPLSKQVLSGEWDLERAQLRSVEDLETLNAEFRSATAATGLDIDRREVRLADGSNISFDGLVIATGAAARRLPMFDGRPGVHVLRTLDDASAINAELAHAASVLVVGGGFIGAEVAATARSMGKQVVLVEPQGTLLLRGLGSKLGAAIENFHRDNGVDVRCGVSIASVTDDGDSTTVTLDDGSVINADVTVIGIGASPSVQWLSDSHVNVDDGVKCDEFCRVLDSSGQPVRGVVAAGDVARWRSLSQGRDVRMEHWTNAQEQGTAAARTLLADLGVSAALTVAYDPTPYVWSDQFGKKIQVVGYLDGSETPHVVKGDDLTPPFLALMERDGEVVGAVGVAMVPALVKARSLIESGASLEQAIDAFAEQ